MKTFQTFLIEIHFSDIFGKNFEAFRKKYAHYLHSYELYVQFTSYQFDTLHRVGYATPDHSDPVGVYAYPLNYILKHPSDIWYGARSKFARVLLDTSKNKLMLAYISKSDMYTYLGQALNYSVSTTDRYLRQLKRFSPKTFSSVTKYGQYFFSLIQLDFENGTKETSWGSKIVPRIRSGQEQTALLRKLGFDAIEDTANTIPKAVINSREPEQICFLTRHAFKVLEVINLKNAYSGEKRDNYVGNTIDTKALARPLVAKILKAFNDGDGITTGPHTQDRNGEIHFFTKKGRRFAIFFKDESLRWRMQNLKIGQKKHKMNRLHDSNSIIIGIKSEYGDFRLSYDEKEKIDDIAQSFASIWKEKSQGGPDVNWIPLSLAYEEEEEQKKRRAEYQQKQIKAMQEDVEMLIEHEDTLHHLEKQFKVSLHLPHKDEYFDLINSFPDKFILIKRFILNHFKGEKKDASNLMIEFEKIAQEILEKATGKYKNSIMGFVDLYRKIIQSRSDNVLVIARTQVIEGLLLFAKRETSA